MIPTTNILLGSQFEIEEQPSKTYQMHPLQKKINGHCDELLAMEQAIYKILNTERYQYLIYSHNYGIELDDLLGEPVSLVCPEVERRITEAVMQDDRVNSIDSFYFDTSKKRAVHVSFIVHTVFGDIKAEKAVSY